MAISKQDIIDSISQMTIMELSDFVKEMEETFGVSAAAAVAVNQASGADADKAEEKTEFNVVLTDIGSNKIATIKAIREITGLGLGEAKALVESAPAVIKEAVAKADAEAFLKKIVDAGAKGELK